MTNLKNEASYFIVNNKFENPELPSWNFKSQFALLKSLKDLINQKKTGQSIVYGLLLAIALLAIFDTQILSLDLMNARQASPIGYKWLKYSFIESEFEKNLKIPDWQVVSKDIVPRVEMSDYHRENRQIWSCSSYSRF